MILSNSNITDTFTVPSELTVVGLNRLAPTTDAGEYIKIDLGSAVEATTLTLKSVAEYKEPTISMTDYNQYGYEVTASSENGSSFPAYLAFNNLTTPLADRWICESNKYNATSGSYAGSARLSTDYPGSGTNPETADGEYLMIKLPDKRKLVAFKLTRQDDSYTDFSPKNFSLYARETSTSDWVNLTQ